MATNPVVKRGGAVLGFERITANPGILGGKAAIRGLHISVSLIVNPDPFTHPI